MISPTIVMRRIPVRDWLLAGLAMLLVAGGVYLFLIVRAQKTSLAGSVPRSPGDTQITLHHVRLKGVTGGKIIWDIEADQFDFSKIRPVLTVTGLRKVALLNDDKVELTLTAETLERNTFTERITVSGNVVVQGEAIQVRAPSANWEPRQETLGFTAPLAATFGAYMLHCTGPTAFDVKAGVLSSHGGVRITVGDDTLDAAGVQIDLPNSGLQMDGPVTARLQVADVEEWLTGNGPPKMPEIPASIKSRYASYLKRQK